MCYFLMFIKGFFYKLNFSLRLVVILVVLFLTYVNNDYTQVYPDIVPVHIVHECVSMGISYISLKFAEWAQVHAPIFQPLI